MSDNKTPATAQVPPGRALYVRKSKQQDESVFEQWLVYLGQDGSRFHVGYREFKNNTARDAFSHDLIFAVVPNGPTAFTFRDWKFTAHRVTNDFIELVRDEFYNAFLQELDSERASEAK